MANQVERHHEVCGCTEHERANYILKIREKRCLSTERKRWTCCEGKDSRDAKNKDNED